MAQNNNSKLILAIVLLVIAGGIFAYRYATRTKLESVAPTTEFKDGAMQSLDQLFTTVSSKGWKDASIWVSPRIARTGSAAAEEIFGATPSTTDITMLDCGIDDENRNNTNMTLQVGSEEKCISVTISKDKNGKPVFDTISKSVISVEEYKKNYL